MAIASVDQGEIKIPKFPPRHDLDQPTLAQQAGLYHRREVANADAREIITTKTGHNDDAL